jgi:hypothetical protein
MPMDSTRSRRSDGSLTPDLQMHCVQYQERIALPLQEPSSPGLDLLVKSSVNRETVELENSRPHSLVVIFSTRSVETP